MVLHVTAGSPWWLFAAANLILFLHNAGGHADSGEPQMHADGARHVFRHDHERHGGSPGPVRQLRGQLNCGGLTTISRVATVHSQRGRRRCLGASGRPASSTPA